MGQTGLFNKITNQRLAITAVALAVLLLTALISSVVSADALTTRSITPSSGSTSATGVQYTVKFTPAASAGAFVIDFCNSASGPLLGQSCTLPDGMDVSGATTDTAGVTLSALPVVDANTLVASKTMTATEQEITFSGIANPSNAGVVYARIVTYASLADAEQYESDDPSNEGAVTVIDNGSVAMYFNNTIGVSGTVLETMTFCVAGGETAITANCGGGSALPAPVVTLGEETAQDSGVFALVPGTISEGVLQTQINTNAAGGVIVRLRSSAECGGLKRAGTNECEIAGTLNADLSDSDDSARFGVKTATATNAVGASNPVGTLQPAAGSFYNNLTYAFNYDESNPTQNGVTSTFGDPFLDTNSQPATGKNMQLTFGATVGTNTPAGLYSTDLSMIAVGKF